MDSIVYAAATSGDRLTMHAKLQDSALQIFQEVTPTGNTALHLAAYHGRVGVVETLIQMMNHNIKAANQVRAGFVDLAGYGGDVEDREMLIHSMAHDLEAGIQANDDFLRATNKEGNTAFHEAAIGGCYKVIKVLLEHDGDLVNIKNKAGETALFKAIEGGYKGIVEKLLPLTSTDFDKRTSDGQTLVHCAVCNKQKGVLEELIDARPGLLQQADNLGRTPLHNAAYLDGMSEIVKILLNKDKSLCYKVDKHGDLALHIAVKEGNLDLVSGILIYAKDCMEIVDNDGRNALHLAVENAVHIHDKISRGVKPLMLLVISKRQINQADKQGKTALDIAMDNMPNDGRLFTGIKWLLEINGAQRTPKVTKETREHSQATKKSRSKWNVQIISVNAVLIATVAFAAAFTLPKENKKHDIYSVFFQFTIICDALAFCSSITSAVLLMYALYGEQEDTLVVNVSLFGLWIALISLLLAFGAGIYVQVGDDHAVVANIVLSMVSIVPIFIRILVLQSKKYIFREEEYYHWVLLMMVSLQIFDFGMVAMGTYIYLAVMACIIAMFIIRRIKYSQSREISRGDGNYIWSSIRNSRSREISRGDGNYIWFIIWYTAVGIAYFFSNTNQTWLISYGIWIIVGIFAFLGRKIYFRSKQIISTDDYDYIWVLLGGSIIGVSMNVIFIVMTIYSSY